MNTSKAASIVLTVGYLVTAVGLGLGEQWAACGLAVAAAASTGLLPAGVTDVIKQVIQSLQPPKTP